MDSDDYKFGIFLACVGAFVLVIVGLMFHPWTIVGAGEKGVLLDWGAVQPGQLEEGWHWRVPIKENIKKLDVKVQKIHTQESAASKDLQIVATQVVLNYKLDPGKVDVIYQTFRMDYESRVIIPAIQESVKATTALFNAEELITKRPVVKEQIKETLKSKLLEYDILLVDLSIVDIQFSEAYSLAIESKQVAEQNALKAERVLQMKRIEAEQIIVTASANKNATIQDAEAKARAMELQRIQATEKLNQYKAIEKWNGVMPQYVGGGIIPFINVDTNKASMGE